MTKLLVNWRQFAVFVTGGLLCALVDVGLMQAMVFGGVHFATATTTGFLAGLVVNYAFHSRVTFESAATPVNFVRYLCVVGINYLLTMAFVSLSVAMLGNPLMGKLVSLPVVALNGFVLSKYWIFK